MAASPPEAQRLQRGQHHHRGGQSGQLALGDVSLTTGMAAERVVHGSPERVAPGTPAASRRTAAVSCLDR
jgi:hypothetical protein